MTMKTVSTLIAGTVLLLAAEPSRADVCDDINKLADRWQKLANYIDDHSDNGKLRKTEIAKVAQDTRQLAPGTKELGNGLVREFKGKDDQRVRALGKQILAALEELGGLKDDDDWDEDVKIIDRLVDILDKVVEQCDK
jgi:hypothetical protein